MTRGLYDILDNEAQLAGVLAHEIGHIVRRHHVTVMQKSAALSAGTQARAARQPFAQILNNMIGTGAEVFARGLDKSAEYEADAIGVVLAARAGYNPFGLVDVLQKLAMHGADDGSLALLFKTHPLPGDRLSQLGDELRRTWRTLPAGTEPKIRTVAATAGPAARRTAAAHSRRQGFAGRARARGAACAKNALRRSHATPARHFRALAWISMDLSFPRRRESRIFRSCCWIPAFARTT